MGKWRYSTSPSPIAAPIGGDNASLSLLQISLPPPPPLLPRPGLDQHPAVFMASSMSDYEAALPDEPLDYSMKSLRQPLPSPPPSSSMSASPVSHRGGAALFPVDDANLRMSASSGGAEVLHRLRDTLLKRDPGRDQVSSVFTRHPAKVLSLLPAAAASAPLQKVPEKLRPQSVPSSATSESESMAEYAANCIKSRLDGCGKRVHLFLGILLHFGMPPGPNGQQMFNRVISFSDEQKHLSEKPTAYFMVLDSKLLALVWSKFKGNTSNEYSTLTRAIRSTRQKYDGIFEPVKNPGKKLYKFGPLAIEQFRRLFPGSYCSSTSTA